MSETLTANGKEYLEIKSFAKRSKLRNTLDIYLDSQPREHWAPWNIF